MLRTYSEIIEGVKIIRIDVGKNISICLNTKPAIYLKKNPQSKNLILTLGKSFIHQSNELVWQFA